jgi:hypothetical protein
MMYRCARLCPIVNAIGPYGDVARVPMYRFLLLKEIKKEMYYIYKGKDIVRAGVCVRV